jgi:hypothetical protein
VSIMEFSGVKVAHETQYFAGPFEPGESRKKWVVSMDGPKNQEGPGSPGSQSSPGSPGRTSARLA